MLDQLIIDVCFDRLAVCCSSAQKQDVPDRCRLEIFNAVIDYFERHC